MKNLLRYWVLSLACVSVLGACNDDDVVREPDGEAVLSIENAPAKAEFERGETRTWRVASENVETIGVSQPRGWTAVCDGTELTVTAPAGESENTEKEGDVVIVYSGRSGGEKRATLAVALTSEPSGQLTFELVCTGVTAASVELQVFPSDKQAGYYYDVCTAETYEEHGGDVGALVEGIIADFAARNPQIPLSYILEGMLDHGDSSDTVSGLPSDADMCFFAVGIDEQGKSYGTAAVKNFHTLAPGNPETCTFELEFDQLLATSVSVKVIPSDPSIRYWTGIEEAGRWNGDAVFPTLVKDALDQYAKENGMPIEEVVKGVTFAGTHVDPWDDLEPSTAYYAYVYAMDDQGNAAGPLFKKQFTTLATSEASVSLVYRYFDGDMLYEADPDKYSNARGNVLVQVKASPNDSAVAWVVGLGKGDMTDQTLYPDEPTKIGLLQGGQSNRKLQQFWVDGWVKCTLMAYASDYIGIDGELYRELLELTSEGASPIEELAPIESAPYGSLSTVSAAPENSCRIRLRHPVSPESGDFGRAVKFCF